LRVNSTQSLILTAPADRSTVGGSVRGDIPSQRSTVPPGAEPLDVSWTDVEVSEAFAGEAGQKMGFPAQQSAAGSASRSWGAWNPAQQYERLAASESSAKGVYLDVHA